MSLRMVLTSLVTAALLGGLATAQSGRGLMHGYVGFQGVGYLDVAKQDLHARIELRSLTQGSRAAYKTETDEHGLYDLNPVVMGEYALRISAPHYRTYETEIYIPSDFECRLAVMLKPEGAKKPK